MLPPRSLTTWRRYLLSAAAVAAVTAALTWLAPGMREANVGLFYLLAVLIAATTLGLGPALLAAGLAVLAFNFFFVPPLHTLFVANPQDVLELLTFFATAIIASGLEGRARAQADMAEHRAAELAALYELSQTISTEIDLDTILPAVARTTARLLGVPACAILLYDAAGRLAERAVAGSEPQAAFRRQDVFLRAGQRVLGVLRITHLSPRVALSSAQQELVETIAAQLVLLLERARLVEESSRTRALVESDRMKSTLLSSVSHDLRTPLAVIKGAATNLLDESVAWDPATQRELLCAVNDETDRLNRLVGNLLEMTRIESGAPGATRDWHDIGELIGGALDRLRSQLAGRALTLDLPNGLPLVHVNYTQIDQVLTNLLENVAKYTPAGTPVTIAARAGAGELEVEVRDAGPGIPEGMAERIFEKFVRAAGPEQPAAGSGLGLAICKGVVEAHGGRIWAERAPSGGARFAFTLPLGAPPAPSGASAPTPEADKAPARQGALA